MFFYHYAVGLQYYKFASSFTLGYLDNKKKNKEKYTYE